jgi:hypothetical protein
MASSTPTQLGTAYKIGFGSLAYTGYLVEDGFESASPRDLDEVPDTNNSVVSILVSNPRRVFRAQFKIVSTGSIDDATFADGAAITITDQNAASTKCIARNGKVRLSRKHSLLDIELTYYPDLTLT